MNDIPNPQLVEEGNHLVVRIPQTFKRRRGRKEIITTGCQTSEPPRPCRTNKPVVVAIARAHRWKELAESGRYTSARTWRWTIVSRARSTSIQSGRVRR